MATPIPMTDQDTVPAGLRHGTDVPNGSTTAAAADASPRRPDSDPRPGSGHRVPTSVAPAARPVLAFPTGGHRCHQYWLVCGFYECVHGHVRRISARAPRAAGMQLPDRSIRQPDTLRSPALLTGKDSGASAGTVPEPSCARQA